MLFLLLFPVIIFARASTPSSHGQGLHGGQGQLKCHQLKLCSLDKVKPFLGDIYDSEKCLHEHMSTYHDLMPWSTSTGIICTLKYDRAEIGA